MVKVLMVCVTRRLSHLVPELLPALQKMVDYTLRIRRHRKDVLDFAVLTEQPPLKKGEKNKARRLNMNKIRPSFLKRGYHYLVKMDDDMIPPKHALARLMKTSVKYKASIVTALTPERPGKCGTDGFSQAMSWSGNENIRKKILRGKPFICEGNAGEAFMLMTRGALRKVVWPSYKHSGDFPFWAEVHRQGIKPLCDPNVICAHKERVGKHGGKLVRGSKWIQRHWVKHILTNMKDGLPWYHGLPYRWWWGETPDEFLLYKLPKHVESGKEPKWSTYPGKKR